MRRFVLIMIFAIVLAAMASLLGLAEVTQADWPRWAAYAMIPATGLSVMAWRRAREKVTRSSAEEGVEAVIDQAARAAVFRDLLVVVSVMLPLSLWLDQVAPWAWLMLVMLVAVIDYWVRVMLRRERGA